MKNDMRQMLLEQYKKYSVEELQEITVQNGYTEEAEEVAQEILQNDRREDYIRAEEIKKQREKDTLKKERDNAHKMLLEQYNLYSEEELEEIVAADDLTEEAERAAREILNYKKAGVDFEKLRQENQMAESDEMEYGEADNNIETREKMTKQKSIEILQTERDEQLYRDVHQLAGDVRFFKILTIVLLVGSVVLTLLSVLFAYAVNLKAISMLGG